jgi:hypothetical protein
LWGLVSGAFSSACLVRLPRLHFALRCCFVFRVALVCSFDTTASTCEFICWIFSGLKKKKKKKKEDKKKKRSLRLVHRSKGRKRSFLSACRTLTPLPCGQEPLAV